ncbi:MAG: S-adenosylmethionine decarboxylase [Clostridia bacterium]|nr:S-adenosylmethionine decarboxylase [Clostridia bacterium]
MNAVMYNYNTWIKYEDEKVLIPKLENMIINSGFTIIKKVEHFFDIQGYTGLWLLAESHFAIHTFPEENKIYIEISSCVKEYFDKFLEKLQKIF